MAFALTPLVDYLVPKVVWTYKQLNNSTLKSVATLLTHYMFFISKLAKTFIGNRQISSNMFMSFRLILVQYRVKQLKPRNCLFMV